MPFFLGSPGEWTREDIENIIDAQKAIKQRLLMIELLLVHRARDSADSNCKSWLTAYMKTEDVLLDEVGKDIISVLLTGQPKGGGGDDD